MATKARRKSRKASSRPVKNRVSAKEALERIQSLSCPKSEIAVQIHFSERGIDPSDIHPRQNVLTFNAWRALGRTVRKGERGFSFTAWVPINGKQTKADESSDDSETESGKRSGKGGRLKPRRTTVFHECQTVPIGQQDGGDPLRLHPDQIERMGQAVALEVLDRESKGEIVIPETIADDLTRDGFGSRWSVASVERTVFNLATEYGWNPRACFEPILSNGEHPCFDFAGPVPADVSESIEGMNPAVRMMFRPNVKGGRGSDTLAELGADRMIELAEDWAMRGVKGACKYLDKIGETPESGLFVFLYKQRDGALMRDMRPITEIDTPPIGSVFELCGESFTVSEKDGSPYAFGGPGCGFYLPERMPIDAGTLSTSGDDTDTLPPF